PAGPGGGRGSYHGGRFAARGGRPVTESAPASSEQRRPAQGGEPRRGRDERPPARPWRTEGMPPGYGSDDDGEPPRRWRWLSVVAWVLLGSVLPFGLLTAEDPMGGARTVAYSEFRERVEAGNVAEVFARGQTSQ